jgi:nicotinamide-nucleotide amidase
VADDEFVIADSVKGLCARADTVIVVGGLGPTHDDVTRSALAGAAGKLLVMDKTLKQQVAKKTKGRTPRKNARMAKIPEGAVTFPNPVGIAAAFVVDTGGTPVYALPGVPLEMEATFTGSIEADLAAQFHSSPRPLRVLRVFGMREAAVAEKIGDLLGREAGLTSRHGVITVVLAGEGADERADKVRERLKDHVYGEGDTTLAQVALDLLAARKLTLATAESVTGGLVASLLVDRSGASAVFKGGVVPYTNEMKKELLGVPRKLIEKHGAVSEEVAEKMARGARRRLGASVGIATTGVAGPERDERGTPVGTGYIAIATSKGTKVKKLKAPGGRRAVRARFAWAVLDLLRHELS